MWGVLGKIFGTGDVVNKGMELLDEAWESSEEKTENDIKHKQAKTKAKVDLMKAYAPFKVAQRYLALMFGFTYISTFVLVIVMYFLGKPVDEVMNILQTFKIGWITITIVTFYFGGGLMESGGRMLKKGKEGKSSA